MTKRGSIRVHSLPTPASRALTPRQMTIVLMICDGYTTRQIALKLGLSHKTVESHRASAMQATGSGCIAHLVRFAFRSGWIS